MRFRHIDAEGLVPFAPLNLSLLAPTEEESEGEVHVFVGPNGTGKTRALCLIQAMLGNGEGLEIRESVRAIERLTVQFKAESARWGHLYGGNKGQHGRITLLPVRSNDFEGKPLPHIAPPSFAYTGIAYIATATNLIAGKSPRTPTFEDGLSFTPTQTASEDLAQGILNLYLQAAIEANQPEDVPARCGPIVRMIEEAVTTISGRAFRFVGKTHPEASIGVHWAGARMTFSQLPDGLRSIIGWVADIAIRMEMHYDSSENPLAEPVIILIDEIETHLHPKWQRHVLPMAQKAFPNAQFFIATHSPFVVSSLNNGWIHKFKLDEEGRAYVEKPIPASKGDSYVHVLEEIMDMDQWFDPESEKLLDQFEEQRDKALAGDQAAHGEAKRLAGQIRERSQELANLMGAEVAQMERLLANSTNGKH